jgi:LacI family transcriptional regulator
VKRKSHITLEDIARRLKVSRVTVSKALRNHPDISAETEKRIRKVAKELGYTPNLLARNLSSRRSHMIGLVVPKIAHSFFGSVIEGVYNTAFDKNYETILTVSQENEERERKHLQTLVSMRVDGILISVSQKTRDVEIFHWINKRGVPLLFIDRVPDPPLTGFSTVVVDDRKGAFDAVAQAINIGHRKIGCIGGGINVNIGKNRLGGFYDAMTFHDVPVNPLWIFDGGFGKDAGYKGFMQLHASGSMPEFLFAMTYPIALGIYEAARETGMRIPHDIDVICFGDSDVMDVISPALSCIKQPSYDLGVKGVELLIGMLNSAEPAQDKHIVLPTELLLRETCNRDGASYVSQQRLKHTKLQQNA